jgi:FAD/FMN-containing dehydrogenase
LRGTLQADASLAPLTWFKTGGPAEVLFEPADEDDLARFLSLCSVDIPVTVIGAGSNLLVRDGGLDGVVVRLGKSFAAIAIEDEEIVAGAGVPDVKLASSAAQAGLAGLAFLRGEDMFRISRRVALSMIVATLFGGMFIGCLAHWALSNESPPKRVRPAPSAPQAAVDRAPTSPSPSGKIAPR